MKSLTRISFIYLTITGLILIQMVGCKKDDPITVTDIEGNTYFATTIGSQIWMTENLKTTRFNDKSTITLVPSNSTWISTTRPSYCWFSNDTLNKALYGAIYNYYAVQSGKLCPFGWHVPTNDEFKALEKSLGMTQVEADSMGWRGTDQGKKMKSRTGWKDNGNGTNRSGFNGLAGGYRYGVDGGFNDLGAVSYWWTSTKKSATLGLYRRLDYDKSQVYAEGVKLQAGKYVRCVKDSI
ncbi:MAG TPA: hypothetical protein DEO60_14980 [Bacteroidales bacterium]|nr:hypothetical protein [Bacteroidales bacterium]HBZ22433.1 hypothetical protein [Bacteroidales bacterium]